MASTSASFAINVVSISIATMTTFLAYREFQRRKSNDETKERLRDCSEELDSLSGWASTFVESLRNPSHNVDLWDQLLLLSKDSVTYYHFTGEIPQIRIENLSYREDSDRQYVTNATQAIRAFRDGNLISATVRLDSKQTVGLEGYSYTIDEPLLALYQLNQIIVDLRSHDDLVNDFDPTLLETVSKSINECSELVVQSLLQKDQLSICPNDYDDATGQAIGIHCGLYEEVCKKDIVDELDGLGDEIEKVRADMNQAVYSASP